MKDLRLLDRWRLRTKEVIAFFGGVGDHTCGMFSMRSPVDAKALLIQASSSGGWDHVSVSLRNRCPKWSEMEYVKRAFFEDHETAMQLHVPPTDHISCHPYCLHLWRPHGVEIPRPPAIMVAPKEEHAA